MKIINEFKAIKNELTKLIEDIETIKNSSTFGHIFIDSIKPYVMALEVYKNKMEEVILSNE